MVTRTVLLLKDIYLHIYYILLNIYASLNFESKRSLKKVWLYPRPFSPFPPSFFWPGIPAACCPIASLWLWFAGLPSLTNLNATFMVIRPLTNEGQEHICSLTQLQTLDTVEATTCADVSGSSASCLTRLVAAEPNLASLRIACNIWM